MKKILLIVVSLLTVFSQRSLAQDSSQQRQLSKLLTEYYKIKDALVEGKAVVAAENAQAVINTINSIDYKIISEGNINALLKDATVISVSRNIGEQRQYFANFSENVVLIAKAIKLTTEPIYQQYCPMKKTNWLSREQNIRNPYYGSSMLTCGKVVDSIK